MKAPTLINLTPLSLLPLAASQGGAVAPRDVDSRLFGSWPLLALAALAMATLGLAPLGLWLLAPIEYLGKPTPITYNTAAPLHVLALLGGGLSDEPLFGRPYPPYLAAGAVVLGGLWSLHEGPHREMWSWDIVEVAAIDLLTADTLADHLWKSRSGPAWSTWGGGHVRIFRSGLVASHHHLAATGLVTPSPLEWLPKGLFISKTVAIAMAYPPQRGVTGAARVRGALPSTFPLSPGEAVNLAWAFSLLTPTTVAAIASESQLGGPSYLWLSLATLYIYLKSGFGTPKPLPSKAALAHTNLAPLAHFLGTSTPWFWGAAPSSRVKAWSLMSNQLICFRTWYRLQCQFYDAVGSTWMASRPARPIIRALLKFAGNIFVPYFRPTSVFGFSLLLNMVTQMLSGFLLALYYVPDPSFVIAFREEYMNEIWWYYYVYKLHVVGVDTIFVLSYLHILKKIFIKNYVEGDLDGWFTGAYAFLIYHVVVFLGITLSTNHLGDVTITIAANIYWSLIGRAHKAYAPLFTNKHLNVDQLVRFMIAHYICAYYYTYLIQLHVMFIHEAWDADSNLSAPQDSHTPKMSWLWDSIKKEVLSMFSLYMVLMTWFVALSYPDARSVNYSFFEQWSETEVEEINFFLVAPHWYFRPHMGLLTICAQHYEGLAWLVSFYLLLNLMPHLSRLFGANKNSLLKAEPSFTRGSLVQHGAFVLFVASILYVGGTLPCGRFYYEAVEGFFGNSVLKLSYQYVYLYMGVLVHVLDISERWITSLPTIKRTLALVIAFLKDEGEVETFEEEKKEKEKSDEEGSTGESGE